MLTKDIVTAIGFGLILALALVGMIAVIKGIAL